VFGDYLSTALANYDERDASSCQRTNKETLVWLARYRLYSWYTVQEAKLWSQHVAHYNIADFIINGLLNQIIALAKPCVAVVAQSLLHLSLCLSLTYNSPCHFLELYAAQGIEFIF
jgi:hypothetical protein